MCAGKSETKLRGQTSQAESSDVLQYIITGFNRESVVSARASVRQVFRKIPCYRGSAQHCRDVAGEVGYYGSAQQSKDVAGEVSNFSSAQHFHDIAGEVGSQHADDVAGEVGSQHADDVADEVGSQHADDVAGEVGSQHADDVADKVGSQHADDVAGEVGYYGSAQHSGVVYGAASYHDDGQHSISVDIDEANSRDKSPVSVSESSIRAVSQFGSEKLVRISLSQLEYCSSVTRRCFCAGV
jgi:hypothetical protein